MNQDSTLPKRPVIAFLAVGVACLSLLLVSCGVATGQTPSESQGTGAGSAIHVRHLLGLEDVRNNVNGLLLIQGDTVEFRRDGSTTAKLRISSIQEISLGTEDKQIGGVPLTLGKAAVPFEGGRAISLFSHKKYGTLTIEYLDENGGLHGAVFEMNKGQGASFEKDLVARGAHIATPEVRDRTLSGSESKPPEVKQ
jgi:hypothetical protein